MPNAVLTVGRFSHSEVDSPVLIVTLHFAGVTVLVDFYPDEIATLNWEFTDQIGGEDSISTAAFDEVYDLAVDAATLDLSETDFELLINRVIYLIVLASPTFRDCVHQTFGENTIMVVAPPAMAHVGIYYVDDIILRVRLAGNRLALTPSSVETGQGTFAASQVFPTVPTAYIPLPALPASLHYQTVTVGNDVLKLTLVGGLTSLAELFPGAQLVRAGRI